MDREALVETLHAKLGGPLMITAAFVEAVERSGYTIADNDQQAARNASYGPMSYDEGYRAGLQKARDGIAGVVAELKAERSGLLAAERSLEREVHALKDALTKAEETRNGLMNNASALNREIDGLNADKAACVTEIKRLIAAKEIAVSLAYDKGKQDALAPLTRADDMDWQRLFTTLGEGAYDKFWRSTLYQMKSKLGGEL